MIVCLGGNKDISYFLPYHQFQLQVSPHLYLFFKNNKPCQILVYVSNDDEIDSGFYPAEKMLDP